MSCETHSSDYLFKTAVWSDLENTHTSLYMHTVRLQWECAVKPIADTMLYIACGPHGDVHVTPGMDPYCKSPNAMYECDHVANSQIHYDYGE